MRAHQQHVTTRYTTNAVKLLTTWYRHSKTWEKHPTTWRTASGGSGDGARRPDFFSPLALFSLGVLNVQECMSVIYNKKLTSAIFCVVLVVILHTMNYFKEALTNSLQCQIQTFEEVASNSGKPLPAVASPFVHFVRTTLILRWPNAQKGRCVPSARLVDLFSKNRFDGTLDALLEKHGLINVWKTTIANNTVLVCDPQITHYIQISGVQLHLQPSSLSRGHSRNDLKQIQFSEQAEETRNRLNDLKSVIIGRSGLTCETARADLRTLQVLLTTDKATFLRKCLPLWWTSVEPATRRILATTVLEYGHPVRRALDNLLNDQANSAFLTTKFPSFGSNARNLEILTETVVKAAIELQKRALPKNLLLGRTYSRMLGFWRTFLQTLIDYGSGAKLCRELKIEVPKWLKRLNGINEQKILVESLCSLIVKLIVLNIHAITVVTSRSGTPKLAVYGNAYGVSRQRRECLETLIRDSLEPSSGRPIGTIRAFPKSNPLKFRPVLKQFPSTAPLPKAARICLQAVKSRGHSRLRNPVSPLNATLSIQRLGALASTEPLYFVKADIKDCYGSVEHAGLKEIISRCWPTKKQALEFREIDIPIRPGKRSRTVKLLHEQIFAWPLCEGKAIILVPTSVANEIDISSEKTRLLNLIDNLIVGLNDKCYRFVRGLPQGASPSSFLADLFLTYRIDRMFEQLTVPNIYADVEEFAIFRTMDDYLVVTNRLDIARRAKSIFENEMHHPGVHFSKDKLVTNWTTNDSKTPSVEDCDSVLVPITMTYCGVEIDCASGALRPLGAYKSFLRDSRCYFKELHFQLPIRTLRYLLSSSYWAYPLGLFHFNGKNLPRLYRNIFEVAVNAAVRFRSYADDSCLGHENLRKFVQHHEAVFYQYTRRCIFKASLGASIAHKWDHRVVAYLHNVAFKRVLRFNSKIR
ncbi:hypothetical protein BIW11_06970 [Tropilaelaps mercedesae]|uniref:Telomerase reverse transcriptase n=1 Tax=Tropilaelaps mercedesae TaxID=418985 RepID=A0A1V9XVZ5_9ACAR|nr:hypothetical protein BIW11_06970 [Tropilaelaps mercedesae]